MHLISVIVPVYNICEYIQMCINSLLQQTYTNLQIILVDDGSVDGSGEICDAAAEKDCRIQVIHKRNGGLASARNSGIENAQGEYILFVDGDDWIEPFSVERLLKAAIHYNADVVVFGISIDYVNKSYSIKKAPDKEMNESTFAKKQLIYALSKSGLMHSACIKMYRRDYINTQNINFMVGMEPIEDVLFNIQFFSGDCIIAIVPDVLYHYVKRDVNSLVTRYRENMYEITDLRSKSFQQMFAKNDLSDDVSKSFLYQEYLWGKSDCILNCYREGAALSGKERTELIRRVIEADEFKNARKQCVHINVFPTNILLKLCLLPPVIIRFCYDILFFLRRHCKKIYLIYRKKMGAK